ncbi:MAG: hypothetical protein H6748_03020 [Spirochaetaceae bacterium]|nr:hypothetical protein [Myxococcales bacterium]MCB9722999.1 hypothetical protein [Spirochaetaceae bacterium]HPG27414.1 hypothetical protein [Myxococcota bacterium]
MSTNALARVAYREAGRATICEILYGPNVLKHAVIDPVNGDGEVVTFSGLPLPIDCRPPAGRRRGEQVGVVPEKLVDAHGVFAYAGIAAERLALRRGRFAGADLEVELAWGRWAGAARRGREELARIAKLLGLSRPVEEFYAAYCEEAERLLDPVWSTVEELAEALVERRELKGHHVDRMVHGEDVLERPAPPI